MTRALIAGCGDVGGALAGLLLADGVDVWGMRRSIAKLPAGVRPLAADLTRPADWPPLPADIDWLFYTAAASEHTEAGYRAAYVNGLRHVLQVMNDNGQRPRRALFTSSTGVYGQQDGAWVDERSPTEPTRFSGKILLEAERLLLGSGLPATAVRLAGIYGPGRTRLLRKAAGGAPCPADPPRYTNRIHRDDCAGVLRHLALLAEAESLYIGVDDEPAPMFDVRRWLAERLGAPPPAPGGDDDAAFRRGGNKRCSNRRLKASGYRFRYPTFRDGYAPLIETFLAEQSQA